MLNEVVGLKVVQGRRFHCCIHGVVDVVRAAVGEHHGLGVGPLRQDVPRPVVLLFRPRLLVLQDDAVVVLGHRNEAEDPRLRPPVHHQPVDVQGRLFLLQE